MSWSNKAQPNNKQYRYTAPDNPTPTPAKQVHFPDSVKDIEFFDTHTHLTNILEKLNFDLGKLVKDEFGRWGKYAGCVNVSCWTDSVPLSLQLQDSEPSVYGAYGLHPHYASKWTPELEQLLLDAMKHPKTVAWGECGLDYYRNLSSPEKQKEVFERQLQLALSVNKPLVIHSRDAEEDTLSIMKRVVPPHWSIHLHCFTGGNKDFALRMCEHFPNLFVGFTGCISFKNAEPTRNVVKALPLERLLLETDGPYMCLS